MSAYSTGEAFTYRYDAVGNRVAMTSTTPLSGTVVTTHTFDAANRLTARAVSDGRAYTYTWSNRGQMLAEYTDGIPVRTFAYDGAGQMVKATVFTLTTEFVYNGLGARVALSVTGETTRYTLDYAAGQRILAETTPTSTVSYLYGHDCLGEQRDDEWLYYLPDAEGYVRQGVDTEGAVVSAWLFDPDGTVLEGPNGPVSHLVCGGVYDWSTGLLYKGGRYFDPMLGIWLALMPLIVIQGRKKKRKGGHSWIMLLCIGLLVTGTLTACDDCSPPIQETPLPDAFTGCTVILACGMGTGANCKNEIPSADYSDQVPLQPLKDEFVKLGGEYKYLDYDTYGAKGDYARAIKTDIATSGDRVYMVGHSAGADAVIWAASELIDEGSYTQVKAIAILDSALLTGDGSGLSVDDWETRRDTQDAADDVARTIPMWAGHSRQGKNASSFPRVDPRMGCQYSQGHLDLAVNAEAATQIINFFGQHP